LLPRCCWTSTTRVFAPSVVSGAEAPSPLPEPPVLGRSISSAL
jgi:hypothetical protein